MKVYLSETFTYGGQHYGPGDVEVEDKETVDALTAAQERVFGANTRKSATVKVKNESASATASISDDGKDKDKS